MRYQPPVWVQQADFAGIGPEGPRDAANFQRPQSSTLEPLVYPVTDMALEIAAYLGRSVLVCGIC